MRGERACSNPLCEHFWLMVPARIDVFAYWLKAEVPLVPPSSDTPVVQDMESLTVRLGRKLYRWITVGDDMFTTPSWCCESKMYWNMDRDRDEKDERYYFCDGCNEVLEKASGNKKGS